MIMSNVLLDVNKLVQRHKSNAQEKLMTMVVEKTIFVWQRVMIITETFAQDFALLSAIQTRTSAPAHLVQMDAKSHLSANQKILIVAEEYAPIKLVLSHVKLTLSINAKEQ